MDKFLGALCASHYNLAGVGIDRHLLWAGLPDNLNHPSKRRDRSDQTKI